MSNWEDFADEPAPAPAPTPAPAPAPAPKTGGLKATSKPFTFNPNASTFVPSWGAPAPAAAAPAAAAPAPALPAAAPAPAPAAEDPTVAGVTAAVAALSVEPAAAPAPPPAAQPKPAASPSSGGGDAAGAAGSGNSAADAAAALAAKMAAKNEKILAELEDDSDPRRHANVVFIGHVDAGKSTISGNVLVSTGQVDTRTMQRYEKEAKELNRESWYLAFIMDTNEEERAKGKTVEVGRAEFETEKRRFTVLDAPGHANYVPDMINGAAQADIGVLVISARRGEFEAGFMRQGQTREHAMLAKTLGIKKLVVAVNKMDEPTALTADGKWNEERYNSILTKLKPFLRKKCGFAVRKDCYFLPMAGITGENLLTRVGKDMCNWYDGPSLLELLQEIPLGTGNPDGPLRVPIIDRYIDRGITVMGKVESGTLFKGQRISISPTRETTVVTSIVLDSLVEVNVAKPGENVRVKFAKLSSDQAINKGYVLCARGKPICPDVHSFIADMQVMQLLEHKLLLTAGYSCMLHVHTIATECTVDRLLIQTDMVTKKKTREPQFVKSGALVTVKIDVPQSVSVETYERMQSLGQFTLRDEGRTVAIGRITRLLIKKKK